MVEEKKKNTSSSKKEATEVYLAKKVVSADLPKSDRPQTPQPKKKQD